MRTLAIFFALFTLSVQAELLDLDVIEYEAFQNDAEAMTTLSKALHEKGVVGIRGVPGYAEKVREFIDGARRFIRLSEEVKGQYAPDRQKGDMFLGYEVGKERFKRADGEWVVDDLKVSYYAFVPEQPENKWPVEVDLKTPFQELGVVMSEMGEAVMRKIGLIGTESGIFIDGVPRTGRMLYYRKTEASAKDNPFWCGAHYDHGMFTVLVPSFYFLNGEAVPEPEEAGLFIKTTGDGTFKKVVSNDPEVMLFQVGEFGQLVSNDKIKATEHRVHKAIGNIERYTLALFFEASQDAVIHSTSVLTQDERYGGAAGEPCSYAHWSEESFKRYLVK